MLRVVNMLSHIAWDTEQEIARTASFVANFLVDIFGVWGPSTVCEEKVALVVRSHSQRIDNGRRASERSA